MRGAWPCLAQQTNRGQVGNCEIPCDCPLGAYKSYRAIAGRVDIPTFVLHRLGAALPIHGRPDGSRLPARGPLGVLAVGLVATPLQASVWEDLLQDHPDKAFTQYICKGMREGFRIGFQRGNLLSSATTNMPSAAAHPEVVSQYIGNELVLGCMPLPMYYNVSSKQAL